MSTSTMLINNTSSPNINSINKTTSSSESHSLKTVIPIGFNIAWNVVNYVVIVLLLFIRFVIADSGDEKPHSFAKWTIIICALLCIINIIFFIVVQLKRNNDKYENGDYKYDYNSEGILYLPSFILEFILIIFYLNLL